MRDATTTAVQAAAPVTSIEVRDGADPSRVLADWQTIRIRTALGVEFRQTTRVVLQRPWWLPSFLFHELLRAVVIEKAGKIRARDLADGWHRKGTYLEAESPS